MLYQTLNPHGGDLYGRPVMLDFPPTPIRWAPQKPSGGR